MKDSFCFNIYNVNMLLLSKTGWFSLKNRGHKFSTCFTQLAKNLHFQLTTLEIQGKNFKMQAIKSNVPDAVYNYGSFQISFLHV